MLPSLHKLSDHAPRRRCCAPIGVNVVGGLLSRLVDRLHEDKEKLQNENKEMFEEMKLRIQFEKTFVHKALKLQEEEKAANEAKKKLRQEERAKIEERPTDFEENPIAYEMWARSYYGETLEYSKVNMEEYKLFMEEKYDIKYPVGRSLYYGWSDVTAYTRLLEVSTEAFKHLTLVIMYQDDQLASNRDIHATCRRMASNWKEIYDKTAEEFDSFVANFAPSVKPRFQKWDSEEWTMENAMNGGLIRDVDYNDALSSIPFLTAPAPFHIAALMQTARCAERKVGEEDELFYPQTTKIDFLLTVNVVVLKLCLYTMKEWDSIFSAVVGLLDVVDKDDAEKRACLDVVTALRNKEIGAIFDPGMIEKLTTTINKFPEIRHVALYGTSDYDRPIEIRMFDELFSKWVVDVVVALHETPRHYSSRLLITTLRSRLKKLTHLGGLATTWVVPLEHKDLVDLLESEKKEKNIWHALLELTAREIYNGLVPILDPFFEGVFQDEPVSVEQLKMLLVHMPTVAMMYNKRRELRLNNWGHRFWAVGHQLERNPNFNNTPAAVDGYNEFMMKSPHLAMTEGERERYRLRFADRTPRQYYRALLDQETTKAKAEAVNLQAEKDELMKGFMLGPSRAYK